MSAVTSSKEKKIIKYIWMVEKGSLKWLQVAKLINLTWLYYWLRLGQV